MIWKICVRNNETEKAFEHDGHIIIPSARGDVITRQGVDIFVIMNEQKSKRIMSITFDTSSGMIVVFQTDEPGSRCHEEESLNSTIYYNKISAKWKRKWNFYSLATLLQNVR